MLDRIVSYVNYYFPENTLLSLVFFTSFYVLIYCLKI